ncbi:MAG: ABC transporter substrate-binding protein [Actinobacteria bacterium]|nr:MAG: ABC transporter substrate-binding protein [Actinomycetota bacterium]
MAPAFPITVGTGANAVTLKSKPAKIVSLSPTATEILFAIGAGTQVTAVDDQSNYPPEAPKSDLSGFKPNVEAIARKNPDLVVIQFDTANLVAGLKALNIPVLSQPPAQTLSDAYTQVEQLGAATGNIAGAGETVAKMQQRIDTAAKSVKKPSTPLRYYHEVDNTFYTATSSTFIGEIYKLAGLTNIADTADKDKSGYPQLSAEYIIQQDPDIIFLADSKCCGETAQKVGARAGWSTLKAVKTGAIIPIDEDLASRWGPRTPDLFEAIVKAINALPATVGAN